MPLHLRRTDRVAATPINGLPPFRSISEPRAIIPGMRLSEGKLKRMKALSNEHGVIAAAAMDQRGSLQKALATARGVDVKDITPAIMSEFKVAVSRALTP